MKAAHEEIAISKFKATCLAVVEQVRRTRKPVLITRFGEPVAEIVPPPPPPRPGLWLGSMQATGSIVGDIVAPAAAEEDWEALNLIGGAILLRSVVAQKLLIVNHEKFLQRACRRKES